MFIGKNVIANYANPKPYLVDNVLFCIDPFKLTFLPLGASDEISVGFYFKNAYDIDLRSPQAIFTVVKGRKAKPAKYRKDKDGKLVEVSPAVEAGPLKTLFIPS